MSGKRGRETVQSKSSRYGSSDTFNKYKGGQLGRPSKDELSKPSLDKKWVRMNMADNKAYEKANKLSKKGGEWDKVYKEANKKGISTATLEKVARKSKNPHETNEYGFKPQVKQIVKTFSELKKGGYAPGVQIKGINVKFDKEGVFGSYSPKTGEYTININSLSVPRMERLMKNGGTAGKSYKDVVIHEIGHGVYYQNQVKPIVMKQGGAKMRKSFTTKEKAIRSAYAKLHLDLRKNTKSVKSASSISPYVGKIKAKSKDKSIPKELRKKARRGSRVEGFAEGYVNYYNHKKYGTPLNSMGSSVGSFLKVINKYKK